MNCQDCRERLDEFVDRELSPKDVAEIEFHLDHCGDCHGRYRFQADFKRLIRVSCEHDRAPAAFREKLRQILF